MIVKHVLNIWRLYKTLRLLLGLAMRREIPFSLRKSLSRDYMICSVLKKEIANFYDALKCCMTGIIRPDGTAVSIIDGDISQALGEIIGVHRKIVAEYEILLVLLEDSDINTSMLHQHHLQISKMTEEFLIQSLDR